MLRLTAAAAAFVAAGCSSESSGGEWMEIYRVARDSWENLDAGVDLKNAAAIPFASLGVRVGNGREQIVVLATDTASEQLWTSAAHIALVTREGRIVRTAGFEKNLSGSQAAAEAEMWLQPHSVTWHADFEDLGLYSVVIVCQRAPVQLEPITILGADINTERVDETCRAEQLGWSFTNSYWVSVETGRVWRSIQHIHPRYDPLQIQVLRPRVEPE